MDTTKRAAAGGPRDVRARLAHSPAFRAGLAAAAVRPERLPGWARHAPHPPDTPSLADEDRRRLTQRDLSVVPELLERSLRYLREPLVVEGLLALDAEARLAPRGPRQAARVHLRRIAQGLRRMPRQDPDVLHPLRLVQVYDALRAAARNTRRDGDPRAVRVWWWELDGGMSASERLRIDADVTAGQWWPGRRGTIAGDSDRLSFAWYAVEGVGTDRREVPVRADDSRLDPGGPLDGRGLLPLRLRIVATLTMTDADRKRLHPPTYPRGHKRPESARTATQWAHHTLQRLFGGGRAYLRKRLAEGRALRTAARRGRRLTADLARVLMEAELQHQGGALATGQHPRLAVPEKSGGWPLP